MKKYLTKVKIVDPCDSIISKIPILTAASHIASWPEYKNSQNRDPRYNRITRFHYLKYFFHDPYISSFFSFIMSMNITVAGNM